MSAVRQETVTTGTVDQFRRAVPVVEPWDETKSAFKTTELLVLLATVIGLIVVHWVSDNFDIVWTMGLISALSIGYMLSRGFAKAGSSHHIDTTGL
jgi:hypothetical protein